MLEYSKMHWATLVVASIIFISIVIWLYYITSDKLRIKQVYIGAYQTPDTVITLYIGREGTFPSADPVNDEAITMCAVKLRNGMIYAAKVPHTQEQIVKAIHHNRLANVELVAEAGYITNYGQFVDEKWAYMLAASAFQTVEPTHFKTRLRPEDLIKRENVS